jgi:hypothetical protein
MEKASEFFDVWLKSQKDLMDNWLMYQEGLNNWLEATKKIQDSFGSMSGYRAGPPHALDLFGTWFTLMLNSSKALTEWIMIFQNVWGAMMEKQTELSKEITEQFFNLSQKLVK